MIEVENLSFSYRAGTDREARVLNGISLKLEKGELGILLGPSGGGKSTLLHLLAGFLHPFSGVVGINGIKLTRRSAESIRICLGMVLQFPEAQLFSRTVFDEIACGPRARGAAATELAAIVEESLKRVGLKVDAGRSPFRLSLGEKRKVILAATLALKPQVLLLDEPTSGLDASGRGMLFQALHALKREGVAILLITHRLEEVLPHADRVFFLSRGSVILQGPAKSFLSLPIEETEPVQSFVPSSLLRLATLKKKLPSFECADFSLEGISASLEALR